MKAVLCSSFTGPADLRLSEIDEPRPAGDEILIDVHAASVSFMVNRPCSVTKPFFSPGAPFGL